MLERPSRLRFSEPNSMLVFQTRYNVSRPLKLFTYFTLFSLVPYLSVRTYHWIDDTGYWEGRIEEKRRRKMAFDYMLKAQDF